MKSQTHIRVKSVYEIMICMALMGRRAYFIILLTWV